MKKINALTEEQILKLFENKKMMYHFTVFIGVYHSGERSISTVTLASAGIELNEEKLKELILRQNKDLKDAIIAVLILTPKVKVAHMFYKLFKEFMGSQELGALSEEMSIDDLQKKLSMMRFFNKGSEMN